LGNQLISAFHAEDGIFRKFGAAMGTFSFEFRPAFHAKQSFQGILKLALWAFHFLPSILYLNSLNNDRGNFIATLFC
jgi:hypothetical protein